MRATDTFICLLLLCYNWFSVDAFLVPPASSTTRQQQSAALPMTTTTTGESNGDDDTSSFRLAYITDVEGNLDYFLRFVQQSNVVDLEEESSTLSLRHDNCYFVFGGDAVDKGPGDIRLVRLLVALKRRYPNRVFLLVGNRDLNKLRFTAELSDFDLLEQSMDDIPPPHWDPKAPSLTEYLTVKLQQASPNTTSLEELNTRVNRLHYLLEHTLGCPKTFEFRRQELAILKHTSESAISDDSVLESFLHEIKSPEGSLRQYLEHASVAVCIGNTLFCHGAVDRQTMRFVSHVHTKFENPTSKPAPGAMVDNVQEWTEALNDFLKQGLVDYHRRPYWNEPNRTTRGGESLMALQNRPAMWGRSIVSNCYGDGGCITTDSAAAVRNNPARKRLETTDPLCFENVSSDPMDTVVADWLRKDGIQRVVVGHKPTGDCPAVLSAVYTGVEIVSADTSFSDTKATDNRGAALGMVEIVGQSSVDNHLELSGTLRDESKYFSKHIRLDGSATGDCDESAGDPNLGMQIDGGWWIKAAIATTAGEGYYHLTKGTGRQVEYKRLSLTQASIEVANSRQHQNVA